VGTHILLYLSRLLLMNMLADAELGITSPVVGPFRVIFTPVRNSLSYQVFRTIGQNRDGGSVMSDANIRRLAGLSSECFQGEVVLQGKEEVNVLSVEG